MATLATMRFPAEAFVLAETLTRQGCTARVERAAFPDTGSTIHVWVDHDDAVEAALAADPTVDAYERLQEQDGEMLFELETGHQVLLPCDVVQQVGGTVLEAVGRDGEWVLDVRFPGRDGMAAANDMFDQYDVAVSYDSIVEFEETDEASRSVLTDSQREALSTALEAGYFEVPRKTTLRELAEDLDITHQALSERLRRGQELLTQRQLSVEPDESADGFDDQPDPRE